MYNVPCFLTPLQNADVTFITSTTSQETFLLDAMFEVPSQPDIAEVVIDEDVIKGTKGPQFIRKPPSDSGDPEQGGGEPGQNVGVANS